MTRRKWFNLSTRYLRMKIIFYVFIHIILQYLKKYFFLEKYSKLNILRFCSNIFLKVNCIFLEYIFEW